MHKRLISIFIISAILLTFNGCTTTSQNDLLKEAISNMKNQDFSELSNNINKMQADTLEKLKEEIDKVLASVLTDRNYNKAEQILNSLKDIESLSAYLRLKQSEIEKLKDATKLYDEVNETYESLNSIAEEIEKYYQDTENDGKPIPIELLVKYGKISESYSKLLSIDVDIREYFTDINKKIENVTEKYNKSIGLMNIKLAKNQVADKNYVGALDILKWCLKTTDYKKDEVMALQQQYLLEWETFVESKVNISEVNNTTTMYMPKGAETKSDFTFYAYLIKNKDSNTYLLKFIVGARFKAPLNFNKVEITSGSKYILKINNENVKELKAEGKDTYEFLTIERYYKVLKHIVAGNDIAVNFISDKNTKQYTVSEKQIKALQDIIELYEIKNKTGMYDLITNNN